VAAVSAAKAEAVVKAEAAVRVAARRAGCSRR
jgi:hypothetical protein